MSYSTYNKPAVSDAVPLKDKPLEDKPLEDKPLVWLHGEIKTPPLTRQGRIEAGYLLRLLQMGISLGMPHSRPMPAIGSHCHELRVRDARASWRVFYRIDEDAIVIASVEAKTTHTTPKKTLETCRRRLAAYDRLVEGGG
ncbi:MAG: type II toxin-antitoxin system RelE/ParE family toxin [Acidobacteriota bacterium]